MIYRMAEVQCPIETGPPVRFNTFQLFKWCWEVADAMEFLAVRKVVHMSLCTKNVLLDSNFSIKLSDFYFARTGDDNRSGVPSSYFNRANTNKVCTSTDKLLSFTKISFFKI